MEAKTSITSGSSFAREREKNTSSPFPGLFSASVYLLQNVSSYVYLCLVCFRQYATGDRRHCCTDAGIAGATFIFNREQGDTMQPGGKWKDIPVGGFVRGDRVPFRVGFL